MILLNSSVKQVQDLRIKLNLVVLHNVLLTKLRKRNQSCSKIQNPKLIKKPEPTCRNIHIYKLRNVRDPVVDQRRLRLSLPCWGLTWMTYKVSPLSLRLWRAHFRAVLLPFEKSTANPNFLSFVIDWIREWHQVFEPWRYMELQFEADRLWESNRGEAKKAMIENPRCGSVRWTFGGGICLRGINLLWLPYVTSHMDFTGWMICYFMFLK